MFSENASVHQASRLSSRLHVSCECTYDTCQIYPDHLRYPSHALNAVHALQPPKYPTSPTGTDILPGKFETFDQNY